MDTKEDESIYRLACECERLFDQRINEQDSQESFQYTTRVLRLLAELRHRFAAWAAHSGVFAKRSLCLDRRLSNLPDIQDLVVRLLDTLKRTLAQLAAESGNGTNETSTNVTEGERRQEPSTPDMDALEIIEEALGRLHRLGNAIRQASSGGLISRVKRFAEGLDLAPFETLSHSSVQGLYPGANQSLQNHLSRSMTNSYETILFMRSRHESLQARRPEPHPQLAPISEEQDLLTAHPTRTVADVPRLQSLTLGGPQQPKSHPRQIVPNLRSELSSMNTRVLRAQLRDSQTAGSRRYRTSSIQINQVDYPPAPQAIGQANVVTCDWCFETHAKKDMEGSNWKRHLNKDFEPYLCIAEKCLESWPRYKKFEDWFEHMQTQHGRRWHQQIYKPSSWICPLCENNPEEYTDSQALLSHMQGTHSQHFTPEQLQMMMRQSRTHIPRAPDECPLCCYDIPTEDGKNQPPGLAARRQSTFGKRRKEPLQEQSSKSARRTVESNHPAPHQSHNSIFDDSDIESEHNSSADMPQKPQFAETVAHHVASHLQVLMYLTIRMITLQLNTQETLSEFKSDSVDGDDGSNSSWRNDLEKMVDIEKTTKMDVSESVELDIVPEEEHPFAVPPPFANSDQDWGKVELGGAISVEEDMFLQELLASGAYQSHLHGNEDSEAGSETPLSLQGGNHGASPVTTITDATRGAIVNTLSQCLPFGGRKYSFTSQDSTQSPLSQSAATAASPQAAYLPSTQDLQRYVGAYLAYFHPHLPFLHIPTLSFDMPLSSNSRPGVGGSGCLILSMGAIGALYEMEHAQSRELFEMAKKMIFLYLEERRKADVRKTDIRRSTPTDQSNEGAVHTPVWLIQAMLLNVVYGRNCGDKTASDIASTHSAALVSLAQAAELLRPARANSSDRQDVQMTDDGNWNTKTESDQAGWLRWKSMEERKRTLYAVFILSSLLVSAYNHTPALANSEIFLDLPCDEEFFSAESSADFSARGGAEAANHNRMTFHDALGELLRTNERHQQFPLNSIDPSLDRRDSPATELKPSTFGCLVLINALHNYIWETRQRHRNKVWTNEETEKMHRHIEPVLKAWQAAWASNPHHSVERPNPFGTGPLSADAIPLLDLAYIQLFVDLSPSKEKFWQRDWDGMVEELSRGNEIVQHAVHSPVSNSESGSTEPSNNSMHNSVFVDSPATQTSSMGLNAKFPPIQSGSVGMSNRSISRREKHLRKAAFYAADSLAMSDKLGVTFADFTSRDLPLQSAFCAFDCAQVLAEWIATLQDRVGRYLGILGQDQVNLTEVPAIMLLEEEDVKLLDKIQEVLSSAEMKMSLELANGMNGQDTSLNMDGHSGYAAKLLHSTALMLDKATVWPVTRVKAQCLETHANHMRARAERSVMPQNEVRVA
ncbi:fungal-specific transcription factor domain-containing protein [Dactylonectria estremocensis]|uniref:Fungal-specific transcription factor domain-containing protein n=1 Tax=Dactylonectria estremocensis TaxID=1079267 RepID=A0A9P9DG69_9HYPO|nr:fungal-specific transcription factor domain-containing protein [Dactylonectria estremocensis]